MYAVIEDGGKQYRVEAGQVLNVELAELEPGATTLTFQRVLLVGDGEAVKVGRPVVEGARVTATVLGETKGPKLDTLIFRRRTHSKRAIGHRQRYLRVRIEQIQA